MLKGVAILCLDSTFNVDSSTSSESSSSESSSDSSTEGLIWMEEDDEYDRLYLSLSLHLISKRRLQRSQDYLNIVNSWNHDQFRKNLRISRRTVLGKVPISADISVIIFLWFIGNTEPLRTLSERFDVSISSVFRIIRRVADFLLYKSSDIIKWPQNGQVTNITNKFQLMADVPNVIGAIDCTHVKIVTPKENSRDFYNRKKYHSINLQGVVDLEMRFMNIYCGKPGSLHDARVLRRSPLYHAANINQNFLFPMNTFIIGDSAYPVLPWLVKPYRDNGLLTPNQRQFNRRISTTRVVAERAFGCFKGRFRRIKFSTEYTDSQFIVKVVMAACFLHNYCINGNDTPVDDDEGNDDSDDDSDNDSNFENALNELDANVDGISHRQRLLQNLSHDT